MSKIAFIFPGQGSQYIGMGKEFYENYSLVQEIFKQASEVLKINMCKFCFEGTEDLLKETRYTQPLVFTVSFAIFKVLQTENIKPDIVAGHSLGEYTALLASGCFDFLTGVKLVAKRGEFMQEASQKYPGTISAIIGLDEEKINQILQEAKNSGIIVAANFNSPGQMVISGEVSAVKKAERLAQERGAKKVVSLKVAGAYHSPLMKEAQRSLKAEIEKIEIYPPRIPVEFQ